MILYIQLILKMGLYVLKLGVSICYAERVHCESYGPCQPLCYYRSFATIKLSFNKGCCHCHCQL